MIYICDVCKFMFKRSAIPDKCPDCGKEAVRETKPKERDDYLKYRVELSKAGK